MKNSKNSEFCLISIFFSELNTAHLLSVEVWFGEKVKLKVQACVTHAAITLLIFLGSFMAASLKIEMSWRQRTLPGTRAKNKSATVPFLGPNRAAAANITGVSNTS